MGIEFQDQRSSFSVLLSEESKLHMKNLLVPADAMNSCSNSDVIIKIPDESLKTVECETGQKS